MKTPNSKWITVWFKDGFYYLGSPYYKDSIQLTEEEYYKLVGISNCDVILICYSKRPSKPGDDKITIDFNLAQ
jgi:hypothetical protein